MINLAWGGLTNGKIDTSILVDVSGRGDYLEATAASNFLRMRADLHAATGVWINPAPGSSAYRPVSIQEQFYAAYQAYLNGGPYAAVAAVPTTRGGQGSNHGWARAVDITGYENSPEAWAWLLAHAAEYGYSWATGKASGERWHWESLTPPGTVSAASGTAVKLPTKDPQPSTLLEDEMPYILSSDAGQTLITGDHAIGFATPDEVQTTSGSGVPTVAVSPRMHNAILGELGKKTGLPIVVSVTGDSTIYTLAGDKLVPLSSIATVQELQNQGAPQLVISPAERDRLLAK